MTGQPRPHPDHRASGTSTDPPTTCSLVVDFRRDWAAIRRRPQLTARARAWAVTERRFDDLDDLLRMTGYCRVPTAECDEVLRRLVLAAHGDELAARVVLQRILPGLSALARRRRIYGDADAMDEIVGAAWIAIRTYRAETRRNHVAANLVRDAAYRAFVMPRRRKSATEVSIDPQALDSRPAIEQESPCDELARVLAEAEQAGLPAADIELLRELIGSGPVAVSARRNVTTRTIRNYRERAADRVRELVAA